MKLAEKITMLRKRAGLSQEELAEKLNVSRQAVSRWEMGTAVPDTNNVVQLARLFGVTTDFLLIDGEEEVTIKDAVQLQTDELIAHRDRTLHLIVAYLIIGISTLGLVVMGIVSSVAFLDRGYSFQPGFEFFARFPIFLEQYNLAWLFVLLLLSALAGVLLLVRTRSRKKQGRKP